MFHPTHLFIPHKKNNYRAHLLKMPAIYSMIALLLAIQLTLTFVGKAYPSVLGITHSITPSDIISLTNDERGRQGLPPLQANGQLMLAAQNKGQDMLSRGYWAHVSPDGRQPWAFIKDAGYSYERAGENLAKDFTDSTSVVRAWMNSPGHKANIMNVYYREIGVAVVSGPMNGVDTVLVVQMFGQPSGGIAQSLRNPSAAQAASTPAPRGVSVEGSITQQKQQLTQINPDVGDAFNDAQIKLEDLPDANDNQSIINPRHVMRIAALALGTLLVVLLTIDIVVVTKNRLKRPSHGHTTLHLIFVIFMLISIFIVQVGVIL